MAIKVPSAAEIAAKFARVAPGRTDDYTKGIQGTSPQDFQTAALAGASSYAQGVQAAIAAKRFDKGVAQAGTRWQQKAVEKGTGRYASGVAGAAGDYETAFAPFQATIASTTLPARGAKGDPKNIERVRVIAEALRRKKVGG